MKQVINEEENRIEFLDERFYVSDDGKNYYPSVTTVLSGFPKGPEFYMWMKDVGHNANIIRDRAGAIGTNVHDALEQIALGYTIRWTSPEKKELYTLEEWKMIKKGYDFLKTYNPKVLHVERRLVSDKMRIGGTVDLIVEMGGKNWLIDWKTSKSIADTYHIQQAVYAKMIEEKLGIKIHQAGMLWLRANTRGMDKAGCPKPPKEGVKDYDEKKKEFNKKYTTWKKNMLKRKIQGSGWQFVPTKFKDEHGVSHEGRDGWRKWLDLWDPTRYIYDFQHRGDRPKFLDYPTTFKL